jgi:calcium/calmodulin-dependent protein kinase (CaM kinase) II
MSHPDRDSTILALNQAMLESVVHGDWSTYASYCSDDLSCFEAETNGVLVEGLPFHQYYFELPSGGGAASTPVNVSMGRPHLRWLSEDAVVLSYTRLTQRLQEGAAVTASCCETRIWQRRDGRWQQVHVHRS